MTQAKKKEVKKVKELLKVDLTDKEILEISREAATAQQRKRGMEADLFGIKQKYKADLEEQENKIQKCADLVNNGAEYRDVDCELIYDWDANTKTLIRLDTKEELRQTKIEPSERQKEIKSIK